MSFDKIHLKGITAKGYHGFYDKERAVGQLFVVDVLMDVDAQNACVADDLDRTVDYSQVVKSVVRVIEGEPVRLIETLAERIALVVLCYDSVCEVTVTVHKPNAPLDCDFKDVSVIISRNRSNLRIGFENSAFFVRNSIFVDKPSVSDSVFASSNVEPNGSVTGGIFGGKSMKKRHVQAVNAKQNLHVGEDKDSVERSQVQPVVSSDSSDDVVVIDFSDSEDFRRSEDFSGGKGGNGSEDFAPSSLSNSDVAYTNGQPTSSVSSVGKHAKGSGVLLHTVVSASGNNSLVEPVVDFEHELDFEPEPATDVIDVTETVTRDFPPIFNPEKADVVLALGGNLGNPVQLFQDVVSDLDSALGFEVLDVSPLIKSKAHTLNGEVQNDYYNCVLRGRTFLSPRDLLSLVKEVEYYFGRRKNEKWASRLIDIDIIVYNDIFYSDDELTIPHELAKDRAFVLFPWMLMEPEALLNGVSVRDLLAETSDRDGIINVWRDWLTKTLEELEGVDSLASFEQDLFGVNGDGVDFSNPRIIDEDVDIFTFTGDIVDGLGDGEVDRALDLDGDTDSDTDSDVEAFSDGDSGSVFETVPNTVSVNTVLPVTPIFEEQVESSGSTSPNLTYDVAVDEYAVGRIGEVQSEGSPASVETVIAQENSNGDLAGSSHSVVGQEETGPVLALARRFAKYGSTSNDTADGFNGNVTDVLDNVEHTKVMNQLRTLFDSGVEDTYTVSAKRSPKVEENVSSHNSVTAETLAQGDVKETVSNRGLQNTGLRDALRKKSFDEAMDLDFNNTNYTFKPKWQSLELGD